MKSIIDGTCKPGALPDRQMIEPLSASGYASSRVQKKVNQASTQRSRSVRLSVLLVLLGLGVFIWGLGYKLSQYDAHGYTIPAAKLLSSNEDSSTAGDIQPAAVNGLTVNGVLAALLSIGTLLCVMNTRSNPATAKNRGEGTGNTLFSKFILSALFFRPPPIHSVY